jgi:hypothetical protein
MTLELVKVRKSAPSFQMRGARLDEGIIESDLRVEPDRAYLLYVGDLKSFETAELLKESLSKRYERDVEVIHFLPQRPDPGFEGNYVVINKRVAEKMIDFGGLFADQATSTTISEDVSHSRIYKEVLDRVLSSQQEVYVNVYKRNGNLETDSRIQVIGADSDASDFLNSKVNQRRLFERLGVPVPRGFVAESPEELLRLYKEGFGDGPAFVNAENGSSGSGSLIVRDFDHLSAQLKGGKLEGKHRFVVSELLDVEYSPSILGVVANPDEVFFPDPWFQLLEGGTSFYGSLYPTCLPPKTIAEIREISEKIGSSVTSFSGEDTPYSFRGILNIDFMLTKEGKLYVAETNPRLPGSSSEVFLSYSASFPDSPTLSELRRRAIFEGALGVEKEELFGYQSPHISWGRAIVKYPEGHRTSYSPVPGVSERELFERYNEVLGPRVFDHQLPGTLYLEKAQGARIIYAEPLGTSFRGEEIIGILQEKGGEILEGYSIPSFSH